MVALLLLLPQLRKQLASPTVTVQAVDQGGTTGAREVRPAAMVAMQEALGLACVAATQLLVLCIVVKQVQNSVQSTPNFYSFLCHRVAPLLVWHIWHTEFLWLL